MGSSHTRPEESLPGDAAPTFEHERIDDAPPCSNLASLQTTDLTGSGRPDVLVIGRGGTPTASIGGREYRIPMPGPTSRLVTRMEVSAFWYENPGWERHVLAPDHSLHLDVGSTLHDVDGDGRVDLIAGQGYGGSDVYWFEQPADPREPWSRHLLTDRFEKYHDLAAADVDGDGEAEVVGLSQDAGAVFYYDVPADPTREPWPSDHLHIVDDDNACEGLAVADVDDDGATEIVAGTTVYHRRDGDWISRDVCAGWDDTRVAVADLDQDGSLELVYAEGDSPTYGTHPGRVAWVDYPDGDPVVLRDDMFCPHSLQTGDLTGNGYPDIYVAEMSLGENDDPEHVLFLNDGTGFTEHVVSRGVATHEAKLVDLDGDGRLDLVGKSYTPWHHVDAWYNR